MHLNWCVARLTVCVTVCTSWQCPSITSLSGRRWHDNNHSWLINPAWLISETPSPPFMPSSFHPSASSNSGLTDCVCVCVCVCVCSFSLPFVSVGTSLKIISISAFQSQGLENCYCKYCKDAEPLFSFWSSHSKWLMREWLNDYTKNSFCFSTMLICFSTMLIFNASFQIWSTAWKTLQFIQ